MTLTDAQLYTIIGTLITVIAGGAKLIYNSKETRIKQLETDVNKMLGRVEILENSNAVLLVHKEQIERCPIKECHWKPIKASLALLALLIMPSCSLLTIKPIIPSASVRDTPATEGPEPLLTDKSLNDWLKGQLSYQNQNLIPKP